MFTCNVFNLLKPFRSFIIENFNQFFRVCISCIIIKCALTILLSDKRKILKPLITILNLFICLNEFPKTSKTLKKCTFHKAVSRMTSQIIDLV